MSDQLNMGILAKEKATFIFTDYFQCRTVQILTVKVERACSTVLKDGVPYIRQFLTWENFCTCLKPQKFVSKNVLIVNN